MCRRYEAYKSATCIADFKDSGGTGKDLTWDLKRGYVIIKSRPIDLDDNATSMRHTNAAQEEDEEEEDDEEEDDDDEEEEEEEDEDDDEEEEEEEEEDDEEEMEDDEGHQEDELVASEDNIAQKEHTAQQEEDADDGAGAQQVLAQQAEDAEDGAGAQQVLLSSNNNHEEDTEHDEQHQEDELVAPEHNIAHKEDTEQHDEDGKDVAKDADGARAQQVLTSNGTTKHNIITVPAVVDAILVQLKSWHSQQLALTRRGPTHNGGNITFTRINDMVSHCIVAALNEPAFHQLLSGPNLLENLMTRDVTLFMVTCCCKTRRTSLVQTKSGSSSVTDLTRLKTLFKMGESCHAGGPTAVEASLDIVNKAIQKAQVRAEADRMMKHRTRGHGSALQQTSAFPLGPDDEEQQNPQCTGTMLENTIDCSHQILQYLQTTLKAWKQQNHKLDFREDNQIIGLICYVTHTLAFPSQRTAVILSLKFGIPDIDACDEKDPHFVYYCQQSRQWRITQARSKRNEFFSFLPIADQISGVFTEYMEFWKLAALDYLPTCDQGQTAPLEPAASDMFHVFGGAKGPKNGHMAMKTVLRQAQKFGTALTSLGQGRHAWANHNSSLDSEGKLVKSYAKAHGTSVRYYQDSNTYATKSADNSDAVHSALCDQRRLTFMTHFGKQFVIPEKVHWNDSGIPQVRFQVAMPIQVNGSGPNALVLMAFLQKSDEYYLQPPSNPLRQNPTEPYFTLLRGSVAFAKELSGIHRWPYENGSYHCVVWPCSFEAGVLAALKSTTLQELTDYGAEAQEDTEYIVTGRKACPPPKKQKRPQRFPPQPGSTVHKAAQWSKADLHIAIEEHLLSCHKDGIRLANSRLIGGQIVLMKQTGNLASVRSGYTDVDMSSIGANVMVVPMTPLEEQQVNGITIDTWHAPGPRASPVCVAAADLSFPVDYVLSADGSMFMLRKQKKSLAPAPPNPSHQ